MVRNYKTELQNEEQKRKLRMALYDQRRIFDVYPEVAQIQVAYEVKHLSAFGICKDSRTATFNLDHTNNFTIDCLNRECTTGFFDLKDEIWNMIQTKHTELFGEMRCNGCEAPDHMYQSCESSLKYTIFILYIYIVYNIVIMQVKICNIKVEVSKGLKESIAELF